MGEKSFNSVFWLEIPFRGVFPQKVNLSRSRLLRIVVAGELRRVDVQSPVTVAGPKCY
jgi:hypothetical protein